RQEPSGIRCAPLMKRLVSARGERCSCPKNRTSDRIVTVSFMKSQENKEKSIVHNYKSPAKSDIDHFSPKSKTMAESSPYMNYATTPVVAGSPVHERVCLLWMFDPSGQPSEVRVTEGLSRITVL